jgi:hypothetical protein
MIGRESRTLHKIDRPYPQSELAELAKVIEIAPLQATSKSTKQAKNRSR